MVKRAASAFVGLRSGPVMPERPTGHGISDASAHPVVDWTPDRIGSADADFCMTAFLATFGEEPAEFLRRLRTIMPIAAQLG